MAEHENLENQHETDVMDEVRALCLRINKQCPNSMGRRVISLLQSLKALEKQEFKFLSRRSLDCSRLQQEIDELDKLLNMDRSDEDFDKSHPSFEESKRRLKSAKEELAEKLRSIVSTKRQLDDMASQSELTQYELRFSELNTQIQKKLEQTRRLYDTYNALLEIKELMLKEISLLNSISLQFQSAMTRADGRIQLVNSLEGILNGAQQKLDKSELALQSEHKSYDTSKEKYAAAILEQRHSSSLLKNFQDECARNKMLRAQVNEHQHCVNIGYVKYCIFPLNDMIHRCPIYRDIITNYPLK